MVSTHPRQALITSIHGMAIQGYYRKNGRKLVVSNRCVGPRLTDIAEFQRKIEQLAQHPNVKLLAKRKDDQAQDAVDPHAQLVLQHLIIE